MGVSGLNSARFARLLLPSAAVVVAIALVGCDADSITPTGRAQAPLSEKMLAEIAAKNMDKEAPILARIFKEEAEMEIWKQKRDGRYALLKTYPICRGRLAFSSGRDRPTSAYRSPPVARADESEFQLLPRLQHWLSERL